MKTYSFLSIIILLLACRCSPAPTNTIKETSCDVIEWDSLEEENILSSNLCTLKFTKLQTASGCMLNSIAQIETDSSFFFVMDMDQRVFMFNQNGDFLRQIGEKGGARNEYITLLNFFLNKKQKTVNLVDIAKGGILQYDYRGNFIRAEEIKEGLLADSRLVYGVDENQILTINPNGPDMIYQYSVIDLKRQMVKAHLMPYLSVGSIPSSNVQGRVAQVDGKIFLHSELSDTIYLYTKQGIYPRYLFRGSLRHAVSKDIEGKNFEIGSMAASYLLGKRISAGLFNMYMTKDIVHFLYRTPSGCYQVFYNLVSKKGVKYNYTNGETSPMQTIWNELVSSNENAFICVLDPTEYKEKQRIRDSYPELDSLLNCSRDGDNPILTFVNFKI